MILGFLWIITFYITNQFLPLGTVFGTTGDWAFLNIGTNNLWLGFGFLITGFVIATRWK